MCSSKGFTLNKVGVTGHGLNFLWREYAFGRQKRGFCSTEHCELSGALAPRRWLSCSGSSTV